jgi:hypothetical protein
MWGALVAHIGPFICWLFYVQVQVQVQVPFFRHSGPRLYPLTKAVGLRTSSISFPPTYDAHKNIRWCKTRWCVLRRCGFRRPYYWRQHLLHVVCLAASRKWALGPPPRPYPPTPPTPHTSTPTHPSPPRRGLAEWPIHRSACLGCHTASLWLLVGKRTEQATNHSQGQSSRNEAASTLHAPRRTMRPRDQRARRSSG